MVQTKVLIVDDEMEFEFKGNCGWDNKWPDLPQSGA